LLLSDAAALEADEAAAAAAAAVAAAVVALEWPYAVYSPVIAPLLAADAAAVSLAPTPPCK
jgi:hypothetical protein